MRPVAFLAAMTILGASDARSYPSQPVSVGFRDFHYGEAAFESPTAEKPQSKLWFHDGSWWGTLWDAGTAGWSIFAFDAAQRAWENVGPGFDDRPFTLTDALPAGERVYVVSHVRDAGVEEPARLYRFDYDGSSRTYSLASGFPVEINQVKSETVVIDRDSTGKLWATWEKSGRIWINRSLGDDRTWGEPFALPVQGGLVKADDICSLAPFGNDKLGVVWSNQNDGNLYFACHQDGADDLEWGPREAALAGAAEGIPSDDHVNLKVGGDAEHNLYVVTKTNAVDPAAPLVLVLKRDANGVWTRHPFGRKSEEHTRPVLLIDEENRELYVFATSNMQSPTSVIRMKKASLDDLVFPEGIGEAFISSDGDTLTNNATASKQNVNSETGLLVLASDETSRYYLHNYIELAERDSPCVRVHALAAGEETAWGKSKRGYGATHEAGGRPEELKEAKRGKARGLSHLWVFEVPEGEEATIFAAAWPKEKKGSDDFLFSYSTNGVDFSNLFTISGTPTGRDDDSDSDSNPFNQDPQSFRVPGLPEGRVWIRVTDSDRGRNDKKDNTLLVDYLAIDIATTCEGGQARQLFQPLAGVPSGSNDELGSAEHVSNLEVAGIDGEILEVQSFPNPFTSRTAIRFALVRSADVRLSVYNSLGQDVRSLVSDNLSAGTHEVSWDGRDAGGKRVAAGMYFYRLQAGSTSEIRKMTLLR